MLAVGALPLAAVDAGLGAALAARRPADLADALDLPDDLYVCPNGALPLGWPGDRSGRRATKPGRAEMVYDGSWGVSLPRTESGGRG
jgi:hypothetical protein